MSSLLFWGPYLTHKAIVSHKREKQRHNNYSRWEGLRDEHDAMKRANPPRQPLDAPPRRSLSPDRDLLTLRDRQEAGDARTAWTAQERWQPRAPALGTSGVGAGAGAVGVQRQKTGAAWDEALPPPMRVSRRRWGEAGPSTGEARLSTDSSRLDVMGVSGGRGSGCLNREGEEEERRRKNDEVDVVESPYEWWK